MWSRVLLTALWGGLMALERRAFLQAMLSRPLVAAAVTGLLLDDIQSGLYIGLVLELLHLGGASMGAAQADHDTLPAIAGAAMAAELGRAAGTHSTQAMWALALLLCLPLGPAGRVLEATLDRRARKYFGRALSAAETGNSRKAARQNLRALWPQFVFYGLSCGVAVGVGRAMAPALQALPLDLVRGLAWAFPALATGAAAIAIQGSHARHRFLAAGVAGGGVIILTLRAWYGGEA